MSYPNMTAAVLALKTRFDALSALSGAMVVAFGIVNENPSIAARGWVSVFLEDEELVPRTLGRDTSGLFLEGSATLAVLVQSYNVSKPEVAATNVRAYSDAIIEDVLSILDWSAIGGLQSNARVVRLRKEYAYDLTERTQGHLQTVKLVFTLNLEN